MMVTIILKKQYQKVQVTVLYLVNLAKFQKISLLKYYTLINFSKISYIEKKLYKWKNNCCDW